MTQVSGSTDEERNGSDGSQTPSGAPLVVPADRVAIFAQSYEFPETAEKLVVDKQLIVREELTVRKVVETRTEEIDETIRRTEVEVERLPATTPASPAAPVPPAPRVAQTAPPPVASPAQSQAEQPMPSEPQRQEAAAPPPPIQAEAAAQEVSFVDPAVANDPAEPEHKPIVFGLKDRTASTATTKESSATRAPIEAPVAPRETQRETPPLVFGINDRPAVPVAPKEQPSPTNAKSSGSEIPQSWWIWCAILSVLAIVLAFYGGSLLASL